MKYLALWNLASLAYGTILRKILVKAINNPDEEWDDVVLGICDRIFDHSE